jgi:hypothetical protein
MPYCRNCGKEIAEGNWLCPSCQLQTQPATSQPQTVIVQQGETSADQVIGAIFLIALLIGGIWFVAAVEVFDCPACHNNSWVSWACSYCGHDGKVALVPLLTYGHG